MNWTIEGLRALLAGEIDFDACYALLWTTAAVDATDDTIGNITGSECSGTGYSRKALGTATIGTDTDHASVDWADITYTSADFTDAAQIIITNGNTSGDSVIAYGSVTVEPNGANITLQVNANGALELTLPA